MIYSSDLNPPQLSAVQTTQGPLLILAGAGTGKTRVITNRIAHLLSEGVPPSRIVALTFTNKAAKEMNTRVASLVDTADCAGITICTFHALCVKILRQDAYRVGYKSNFSKHECDSGHCQQRDSSHCAAIGQSSLERKRCRNKTSLSHTLRSYLFLKGLSKRACTAIAKFTELIDCYESRLLAPRADFCRVLSDLLAEIGYEEALRQGCKTPAEAASRNENVGELVRALAEYRERAEGEGIAGFLSEISLDQSVTDEASDEDAVTLITIHAAKGLEFPHVFLIGVEEGLIPHERCRMEGKFDEERRLFYVGITRAMRTLTLTHCQRRMRYGRIFDCDRSSFLNDLDPRFVDELDFFDRRDHAPADPGRWQEAAVA